MYIKRHIEKAVLKRAEMKGAVVITGARQVGKTTLIENLKPDITGVTFDSLPVRQSAVNEPSVFFDLYPPPIFANRRFYRIL